MCMHCYFPFQRFECSRENASSRSPLFSRGSLTRRSFNAGALATGLALSTRALAADSETVKIGTFGPFTGPAAGLGLQAK